MRIGIVTYNYEPNVGSSVALKRLIEGLKVLAPDNTYILLNVTHKSTTVDGCINITLGSNIASSIEEFDHLLINEPTYDVQTDWVCNSYFTLLQSIPSKSRSLWLQGEYATHTNVKKMLPFYKLVVPTVDVIYTIAYRLFDYIKSNILSEVRGGHPGKPELHTLPGCGMISTDVLEKSKEDAILADIGYCARITSMKKPTFFIRLMHALQKINPALTFQMRGRIEPGIQNVQMQENVERCGYVWDDIYHGEFLSEPHPTIKGLNTSPVASYPISWACSMIGRGNTCNFAPRVELTTIECWQQGTIPILLEETVPDYVPKDSYISLTWLNINTVRKDIDSEAAKVMAQIEKINNMSMSDRYALCSDALRKVKLGWNVEGSYNNFLHLIKIYGN